MLVKKQLVMFPDRYRIPSGGLDVPLILSFSCSDEWTLNTLNNFLGTFYPNSFAELVADISSDKEPGFEVDLHIEAPTEEAVNNSVEVSDDHRESCYREKVIFLS